MSDLYAVLQDASGQGAGIQEGDTCVIVFDQPTNGYEIDPEDLDDVLVLNNGHVWGEVESVEWSEGNTLLTVTFAAGTSATVATGDTITIDVDPDTIRDYDDTVDADASAVTIAGSDACVAPRLLWADAYDDSEGGPGIQEDDTLVLAFDLGTNGYTGAISSALLVPGSWGAVTGAWSQSTAADDTFTITFGAGSHDVAEGDIVTVAAGYIKDDGENVNAFGAVPIWGDFGFDYDDPVITITAPEDGCITGSTSIYVTGSAADADSGVATVYVNGVSVPSNFSCSVDLPYEGANDIFVEAEDQDGNSDYKIMTIYRDSEGPELIYWEVPSITGDGPMFFAFALCDAVSGVDEEEIPTVVVSIPGYGNVTAEQYPAGPMEDGVWEGCVTVPNGIDCIATLTVTGAKDEIGNSMSGASYEFEIDTLGPPAPTVTCIASRVSPMLVKGKHAMDAWDVQWRYKEVGLKPDENWVSVREEMESGGDACLGNDWWWAAVDLYTTPGKVKDLTDAERRVEIEVRCLDALLNATDPESIGSQWLTWNLTQVGSGDLLIQDGQKLIVCGPQDTCLGYSTAIQVSIIDLNADTSEYTLLQDDYASGTSYPPVHNWVRSWAEGHHRLEAGYVCEDGEKIAGPLAVSHVYVIKPMKIRLIAYWDEEVLPAWDDQIEWDEIEEDNLWCSGTMPRWGNTTPTTAAKWVLYELPYPPSYSTWADYMLVPGQAADAPTEWESFTNGNCLWWVPANDEENLEAYAKCNGVTCEWDIGDRRNRHSYDVYAALGKTDIRGDLNANGVIEPGREEGSDNWHEDQLLEHVRVNTCGVLLQLDISPAGYIDHGIYPDDAWDDIYNEARYRLSYEGSGQLRVWRRPLSYALRCAYLKEKSEAIRWWWWDDNKTLAAVRDELLYDSAEAGQYEFETWELDGVQHVYIEAVAPGTGTLTLTRVNTTGFADNDVVDSLQVDIVHDPLELIFEGTVELQLVGPDCEPTEQECELIYKEIDAWLERATNAEHGIAVQGKFEMTIPQTRFKIRFAKEGTSEIALFDPSKVNTRNGEIRYGKHPKSDAWYIDGGTKEGHCQIGGKDVKIHYNKKGVFRKMPPVGDHLETPGAAVMFRGARARRVLGKTFFVISVASDTVEFAQSVLDASGPSPDEALARIAARWGTSFLIAKGCTGVGVVVGYKLAGPPGGFAGGLVGSGMGIIVICIWGDDVEFECYEAYIAAKHDGIRAVSNQITYWNSADFAFDLMDEMQALAEGQ